MEQLPYSVSFSEWPWLKVLMKKREKETERLTTPSREHKTALSSINNILMQIQKGSASLPKGRLSHLRAAELKATLSLRLQKI